MSPILIERVGRRLAGILGFMILIGVMQITSMNAAADISESFETGFGGWQAGMNYDPAFFDVSRSSLFAYDGLYSVKMQAHGLPTPPYPRMTVWIEKQVRVLPSTLKDIGVTFHMYNENATYGPENVVAYFGESAPVDYPDFTVIGQTESTIGWKYFTYQTSLVTPASGWLYAAVGFNNHITGFKFFFFDLVNLTGVSDDWAQPTITNLQPLNHTTISDNTPLIGASYSDASGIDTATGVALKVDSADVTLWSTVTGSDVAYTPSSALVEGLHNVYLQVADNSANRNTAVATWQFTVDSTPPSIANLDPVNHSTVGITTPSIGASYGDASGVNTSMVVLKVDATDVTASATVNPTWISYSPATPLSEGLHNVYLSASDNSNPPNTAVKTWQFTVDSLPPVVTNLRPPNLSTTSDNTPTIAADYSDPSLVDMSSVILRIDGSNVTSSAFVTMTDVSYTPSVPMSEGLHSVYLLVRDDSPKHNLAITTWQFTVDSLAPSITNLRPRDAAQTNDSTPLIVASYWDSAGIATSGIYLKVDSTNVTASAAVGANEVTYTPSIPLADGAHTVELGVRDASPNHLLATATWSFTVDATPPTTTSTILTPKYTDAGSGKTYVNSFTPLRLIASDGSGVQTTWYTYYSSGETPPAYRQYSSDFTIPNTKSDGLITVKFKSVDILGNEEAEQSIDVYLDNTAPTGDSPGYSETTITYINSGMTVITIDSNDTGSGVQAVGYGVEDQNCPQTYTAPFTIGSVAGEGEHRIYYKITDNVGNVGTVGFAWIFLDTVAPTAVPGDDKQVPVGALVEFDGTGSTDTGSGIVNYTWTFDHQGSPVTLYGDKPQFRFSVRGDYEVTLTVRDRAGNTGADTMRVTFNPDVTGTPSESTQFPWWLIALAVGIVVAVLGVLFLLAGKRKTEQAAGDEQLEAEVPSTREEEIMEGEEGFQEEREELLEDHEKKLDED